MSIIAEVNECRNCGKDLPIGVIYCLDCTFYNKLKKDKEMSIFKIDDKVFDLPFGWGKVQSITGAENYPVSVIFHNVKLKSYSPNGIIVGGSPIPTLSFKEYDLIKGGFSQERPKPEIEKGTVIYVKSKKRGVWQLAYFERFEDGDAIVNFDKDLIGGSAGFTYEEYSLSNPLTEKS